MGQGIRWYGVNQSETQSLNVWYIVLSSSEVVILSALDQLKLHELAPVVRR